MKNLQQLAEEAFDRREYLRILGMSNMPQSYDDRKKAFIQMESAREASRLADLELSKYASDLTGPANQVHMGTIK